MFAFVKEKKKKKALSTGQVEERRQQLIQRQAAAARARARFEHLSLRSLLNSSLAFTAAWLGDFPADKNLAIALASRVERFGVNNRNAPALMFWKFAPSDENPRVGELQGASQGGEIVCLEQVRIAPELVSMQPIEFVSIAGAVILTRREFAAVAEELAELA